MKDAGCEERMRRWRREAGKESRGINAKTQRLAKREIRRGKERVQGWREARYTLTVLSFRLTFRVGKSILWERFGFACCADPAFDLVALATG